MSPVAMHRGRIIAACLCWSLAWVRYKGSSFLPSRQVHVGVSHSIGIAVRSRSFQKRNDTTILEFVHIPKTGGETIEQDAAEAGIVWGRHHWQGCPPGMKECQKEDWSQRGIHLKNLSHPVQEGWELWQTPPSWFPDDISPYKGKALFAVVQNPYDRFLSHFYCPQFGRGPNLDPEQDTPEELNVFLMERLNREITWTAQYLPQSDFIYDENGKQTIDYVLKYENLTAEFSELMKHYQLSVTLNVTVEDDMIKQSRKLSTNDLYPETVALINRVAARDFRLLGYEKKRDPSNRRPFKAINDNKQPSVAFLFMMTDKPMDEDLWEQWLPQPTDSRYSIFIHGNPSTTTVPLGRFFCRYAIPAVPTSWYWLHYGMMQVLQTAFEEDPNAQSFVFISASSIPIVSFDEMYESVLSDSGKSRFCFTNGKEIRPAWKHVIHEVGLKWRDARKAEMWSVISRSHASFLLDKRSTMDDWHTIFKRTNQKRHTGAPDEIFFPTMLNLNYGSSGFHSCDAKRSLNPGADSCCPTEVVWNQIGSAYLKSETGERMALISKNCTSNKPWANPCSFTELHEEGLIALRNQGSLFLRKVTPDAVIRTISNETVPLIEGLVQFYTRRPIKSSQLKVLITKPFRYFLDYRKVDEPFQCVAPTS